LTIKKGKAKFCFEKKLGEGRTCEEKELNKHLIIAKKRQITGDKEK
jgi:hypothetical protein